MENDFIGRRISYGAAIEEPRGVGEAAATHWLPHLEAGFQDKQTKALNESALGVIDKNNDSIVTEEYAEGNISGKVQIDSFGLLLYAALGSKSVVAGTVAGTYKHTFNRLNSNQAPALTLFKKDPVDDVRYVLSVLKSLEISIVTGEYVKYTANFISRKGEDHTNTVSFTVSEAEFTAKYGALKLAAAVAGLGAATKSSIKSATITIEREAEAYYEVGSVTPAEIHNKTFDVTIEVEKRHSDNTFKDAAHNNTHQAVSLGLVNTDDKIGTGNDGDPSLTFILPKVAVSEWELDQGLDDVVMESFTLQGLFSLADGYQLRAELVNETASY